MAIDTFMGDLDDDLGPGRDGSWPAGGDSLPSRLDFFRALYDGVEGGVLDLRAIAPGRGVVATTFVPLGRRGSVELFAARNEGVDVYFGVALRRDNSSGALENCAVLSALFVDLDYKMSSEELARKRLQEFPLPPSSVISSGGGLHAYWFLAEPLLLVEGSARAYDVLRRLCRALAGDPAAAEPARILRIPGTLNQKYAPPRDVVIELLEPARRYTIEEIEAELPTAEPESERRRESFTSPPTIEGGERNVTLYKLGRSLKAKGLSEAAILAALLAENQAKCDPPLDEDEIRGKIMASVLSADRPGFRVDSPEAVGAVNINQDRALLMTAGIDGLVKWNETARRLYQRGSDLVEVQPDPDTQVPTITPLDHDGLKGALADAVKWVTLRGRVLFPVDPPGIVIGAIQSGWRKRDGIPVLRDLVTVPTFTREGRLVVTPGYAEGSRLWYAPPAGLVIPSEPAGIERARDLVRELIQDFPFVDDASHAHAIALLVQPFVRELIEGGTPLYLADAPAPGTGKTLLVDTIASVVTGQGARRVKASTTDEELGKQLFAAVRGGARALLLDNLGRDP